LCKETEPQRGENKIGQNFELSNGILSWDLSVLRLAIGQKIRQTAAEKLRAENGADARYRSVGRILIRG
jgi:hypothetical protein